MAEAGIEIARARALTVEKLSGALAEREGGVFPAASLALSDEIHLSGADDLRAAFASGTDARRRGRPYPGGPHTTDLNVRHTAKRADARDCSTGEQKALLISIMLAGCADLVAGARGPGAHSAAGRNRRPSG
jgi:DNA replication and repair protein RecF